MKKLNWVFRRFLVRQMAKRTQHGLESQINFNCISQVAIKMSNELLFRGWDGKSESIPHYAGCNALSLNARKPCNCGTMALANGEILRFLAIRFVWVPKTIRAAVLSAKYLQSLREEQRSGVQKVCDLVAQMRQKLGKHSPGRHVFYRSPEESCRQITSLPVMEGEHKTHVSVRSNS